LAREEMAGRKVSVRQNSKVLVVEYPDGRVFVTQVIAMAHDLAALGCKVTFTRVENSHDFLRKVKND
jgi:hypothetical protein